MYIISNRRHYRDTVDKLWTIDSRYLSIYVLSIPTLIDNHENNNVKVLDGKNNKYL